MKTPAAHQETIKKMKLTIAALSVALAACVIYIALSSTGGSDTTPGTFNTDRYPGVPANSAPAATQDAADAPAVPAPVTAAPTSTPVGQSTPVATPAPNVNPSTPTPVAPQTGNLNPPHGQPGHRCDIPVGSPLN